MAFVDEIEIRVRGGHGGPGSVHFQRAKYKPRGGPDGGDGGRGGDVIVRANTALQSLGHFKNRVTFEGEAGEAGDSSNCTGSNGRDLVIHVPPGTEIIDAETNEVVCDLVGVEHHIRVARGGKGGMGNTRFATSTNQAPEYAQPGLPGEERLLLLRLKLMADVGLVGLPNAGKSTLISAVSHSKSRVADYPFTTLIPHLGVVENKELRRLLIADIPGIIEGASHGVGLGLSFLRHIERVRAILFVIDVQSMDPAAELAMLQNELGSYSEELLKRPAIVALNKMDVIDYDEEFAEKVIAHLKENPGRMKLDSVIAISAMEHKNLDQLTSLLFAYFPGHSFAESLLARGQEAEEILAELLPRQADEDEEQS